MKKKLKIFTRH